LNYFGLLRKLESTSLLRPHPKSLSQAGRGTSTQFGFPSSKKGKGLGDEGSSEISRGDILPKITNRVDLF
jgi:hypothetical protein